MKTVEILISPAGQVIIDATGFRGPDCEKATAFLEKALGELAGKQRKPEFYRQSRRNCQQRVGL